MILYPKRLNKVFNASEKKESRRSC